MRKGAGWGSGCDGSSEEGGLTESLREDICVVDIWQWVIKMTCFVVLFARVYFTLIATVTEETHLQDSKLIYSGHGFQFSRERTVTVFLVIFIN